MVAIYKHLFIDIYNLVKNGTDLSNYFFKNITYKKTMILFIH